ncbi:unnamed protein product [Linum trigynum]|uniref:Uncharacterized protein n=1 Tax=Linum trigynum TaxID=586398 RepID=A0AAV2E3V2_9ROSI
MFHAHPPPEHLADVVEHLLEEAVLPPETSPPASEDQAAAAEDLIVEAVQDVPPSPPAEQPAPSSSAQAITRRLPPAISKICREITEIFRFLIEESPLIKQELTQLFRQVLADEIPLTASAAAPDRRGVQQETALPQSSGNDQETQETASPDHVISDITDPAAQTEPPSSDIAESGTEQLHQNERAEQVDNRLSRGTQMTTGPFNPLANLRAVPPPSNFTGESSAAAGNRGTMKETDEDEDDGERKQNKP